MTEQPNTACDMGVGCEEHGTCYAAANGEPDRCGKSVPVAQRPVPVTADDLVRGFVAALSAGHSPLAVVFTGKMVDYINDIPAGTSAGYYPALAELEKLGIAEGSSLDSLKTDQIVTYAMAHHKTGNDEHLAEILTWLVSGRKSS